VISANQVYLERLLEDAIVFVEEMSTRADTLPLIYFSGGKESMVMMDIFKKAGKRANLLFAATGWDFPEDLDFMRALQQDPEYFEGFNLHMELVDADAMLKKLKEKGYLHALDPWCRHEVKYPIRMKAIQQLYKDQDFIVFEGSRWYENDFRRSNPKVAVNEIEGYTGQQTWAHVLAEWNGFDVWAYTFLNGLKVNRLYKMGYQRTTCWLCPIVNPFHVYLSQKHHPELWKQVEDVKFRTFQGQDHRFTPF
jgi:phosphoadenosine phosphosulfate reductase